ncbi:MAG TPA: S8 family serine peptidase, partial [Pseudonocardiaceae bacterium]|nr:S8 family serine peptidase [Pseudonocardiaceae bacterium]
PDVITASIGYGFDSEGFPGRYLEDDPVSRTIVAGIVQEYGITVCISANDGTRMFTPAAVGPDGGSAATDLARSAADATSVADDGMSTTPSEVPDSGAIAVGGTTLDDVIAAPPQDGSPLSANPTFAETRISGGTSFSSGFGSRVDVSAPSDNVAVIAHHCLTRGNCQPTDAVPVLEGGTSASAPMTAAAVADALQVARLIGHPLSAAGVRALLERTGRQVPTQPQIDQPLHVGPQIDVGAAVDALLGPRSQPVIARLSVAHRLAIGNLGATFEEATDPAAIVLAGQTGEGLEGPITFGVDGTGIDGPGLSYALTVGSTTVTAALPYARLTPRQLFAAAGQPLISASTRSFPVTFQVSRGRRVVASATRQLTFGPTDGTHAMAPAPVVPPVVAAGAPVTVSYDLAGVRGVNQPELLVSSIGHWSPATAPLFRAVYAVPLTATTGTVTIPAQVLAAGGGIYGVGIEQNAHFRTAGAFAPFRVATAAGAARPGAPLLAAGGQPGHDITITRKQPQFTVGWNTDGVRGATGAMLEISAPGPTVYNLFNTFTNPNGSGHDSNGVDTGSTVYVPLPARSGRLSVDALKLGLATSLNYSVRILATTGGGSISGQASPTSFLEFDDGLLPGDATLNDFSIVPGGGSVVASNSHNPDGSLAGSSLQAYDPATGQYGTTFATDATGQNAYYLYGADPGLGRTLALEKSLRGPDQDVQIYDSASGQRLADQPVDAATQYSLVGGRVDPVRHRAVLLGHAAGTQADTLLTLDVGTGAFGAPLGIDTGTSKGNYTALDTDNS